MELLSANVEQCFCHMENCLLDLKTVIMVSLPMFYIPLKLLFNLVFLYKIIFRTTPSVENYTSLILDLQIGYFCLILSKNMNKNANAVNFMCTCHVNFILNPSDKPFNNVMSSSNTNIYAIYVII